MAPAQHDPCPLGNGKLFESPEGDYRYCNDPDCHYYEMLDPKTGKFDGGKIWRLSQQRQGIQT
jgi:hypothetical protein